MSHYQNARQNHDIMIANQTFENVGMTVAHQITFMKKLRVTKFREHLPHFGSGSFVFPSQSENHNFTCCFMSVTVGMSS